MTVNIASCVCTRAIVIRNIAIRHSMVSLVCLSRRKSRSKEIHRKNTRNQQGLKKEQEALTNAISEKETIISNLLEEQKKLEKLKKPCTPSNDPGFWNAVSDWFCIKYPKMYKYTGEELKKFVNTKLNLLLFQKYQPTG